MRISARIAILAVALLTLAGLGVAASGAAPANTDGATAGAPNASTPAPGAPVAPGRHDLASGRLFGLGLGDSLAALIAAYGGERPPDSFLNRGRKLYDTTHCRYWNFGLRLYDVFARLGYSDAVMTSLGFNAGPGGMPPGNLVLHTRCDYTRRCRPLHVIARDDRVVRLDMGVWAPAGMERAEFEASMDRELGERKRIAGQDQAWAMYWEKGDTRLTLTWKERDGKRWLMDLTLERPADTAFCTEEQAKEYDAHRAKDW